MVNAPVSIRVPTPAPNAIPERVAYVVMIFKEIIEFPPGDILDMLVMQYGELEMTMDIYTISFEENDEENDDENKENEEEDEEDKNDDENKENEEEDEEDKNEIDIRVFKLTRYRTPDQPAINANPVSIIIPPSVQVQLEELGFGNYRFEFDD